MKCGIVRYDHLTSFETLAHTFSIPIIRMKFLENRMFLKKRHGEFFSTFSKKSGTQLHSLVTSQPESCWRLLVCNQWKFYIRPRYFLRTVFWFFIFFSKNNFSPGGIAISPWRFLKNLENFMRIIGMEGTLEKCGPKFQRKSNDHI